MPESINRGGKPEELLRFTFPRQTTGEYLCLSDYFAPADSGRVDVAAFQVVTAGEALTLTAV